MFTDTFHATMAEAMDEVARRRSEPIGKELITRIEASSYGGFRVRSVPADFWLDLQAMGGGMANHPYKSELETL